LCEVLGVNRSGYYKWKDRKPSLAEIRLRFLMNLVSNVYEENNGIYGYRRIAIYLNYFEGIKVTYNYIHRIMRILGLKSVIRRKRHSYKRSKPKHTAENILDRQFQEEYEPMEVLLTDITEFKYGKNSTVYLSAILDYGANKIVGYKLSNRNNNELVKETFNQVKDKIMPNKTLIHSDRGTQYTSHFFREFIKTHKAIQSMSRAGKCIDNGPMENFWGIIKEEMYRLKKYETLEELKADIDRYIEFYNTKRVTLAMGVELGLEKAA